jgi:hypothetical protein
MTFSELLILSAIILFGFAFGWEVADQLAGRADNPVEQPTPQGENLLKYPCR